MSDVAEFKVMADGWVAGQNRKKGDIVELTLKAAQYENVELVPTKTEPEVQLTGSLDDPLVKSTGLPAKAAAETKKRRRK